MQVLDLGRKTYEESWNLQKQLVQDRVDNKIEDALILVEHEPVYTTGRASGTSDGNTQMYVEGLGAVPVFEVERGGKLTFHGPGQLVGYPIFKLHQQDLRAYLREMERILVASLAAMGLPARPCPETLMLEPGQLQTGVWIRDRKIASIGIAVKHWVTYHGFALNFATDLRYFQAVEPCGFQGTIMTTMEHELKRLGKEGTVSEAVDQIKARIVSEFRRFSEKSTDRSSASLDKETNA